MAADVDIEALIDLVEESAFRFRAYGSEVLDALEAVRDLWQAGQSSMAAPLPREGFSALVAGERQEGEAAFESGGTPGARAALHPSPSGRGDGVREVDLDFCYLLEQALSAALKDLPAPGTALDEVIDRYRRLVRPKSLAFLEALASQADLRHSKRDKEAMLQKLDELASQGAPLPPEAQDIAGFSAPRFRRLAADIPAGQSILDFYIMNQIRYKLSRSAHKVVESLRETHAPRNVLFGSLELGTPGAEIHPVDGGNEFLVVLSRALWTATSLATAIIAKCVKLDAVLPAPTGFDPGAAVELEPHMRMLDAALRCEDLDFEFPTVADERQKIFWELLDSATKFFIMGHEYAHLLMGHVGPSAAENPDTAHLWNQELVADVLAVQLVTAETETTMSQAEEAVPPPADLGDEQLRSARQVMADVTQFYTASGAALVLYLFWRMDALHGRSVSTEDSHPPVAIRLANVWTYLRMTLVRFEKVYGFCNLMLRDFLSLLPPVEGSWRDRFAESAFRQLAFYPHEAVIDMLDKVNTGEALAVPSLEPARARLEELFRDPAAPYEEKYSFREECIEMVRISREADPLRSIKDAVR